MRLSTLSLFVAGLAALVQPAAAEFKVSTDDAVNGGFAQAQFANGFGCTGGNVSPHVVWDGAPADAKSFVATIYDPDAPTGSGWWHWVVANIPATNHELARGAGSAGADAAKLPAGAVQISGDAGTVGYFGPCPPPGPAHHYVITVHALKVDRLELPANATPALVGFMAWANGIGKTSVTVTGGR